MKAELDAIGVLTIRPETPTEAYAMSKWTKDNYDPSREGNWKGSCMVVHTNYGVLIKSTSAPCSDCRNPDDCCRRRWCAYAER